MNPLKYAQMMKYLTRAKKANPELPNVFPASKAPIPPVRKDVEQIDAVNQFMLRNPRAEGGRIGFADGPPGFQPGNQMNLRRRDGNPGNIQALEKIMKEKTAVKDKKVKKFVELVEKGDTTTEAKNKVIQLFKLDRSKKAGTPPWMTQGKNILIDKGVLKRKKKTTQETLVENENLNRNQDIKKIDTQVKRPAPNIKEVKYKNIKTGETFSRFKPVIGESNKTVSGSGFKTLKEAKKIVDNYFKENPKQIRVRDPKKRYDTKDRRTKALEETDPTKAAGTKKYNYHHIRQIAGGVPLTTDDVMIINQRINSKIGGKFNESLNRISTAIQKNNILALEAMNAKDEGAALAYMKRSDELNAQAEKIVNSAIDDLPEKYKSYVGFNKFTLPRDEYGLPISNEPMIIKKVGGMPIRKDAIDLTTLNLKQEKEFRDLVKTQAQAGKTGQIKGLAAFIKRNFPDGEIVCNLSKGINCNSPEAYRKSLDQLTQKSAQGDKAAKATLTKFGSKVATAGRFIKGALGPLAIASEIAIEGGIALNQTLNEGVPIKQAFADSLTNKYLLGPKLQIDKEAEIAKEMAKGEEFAMAERGRRMFLPEGAPREGQLSVPEERRLKKREEEMKALYPDLQYANPDNQKIDQILKEQGVFSPYTLGYGMQQMQPGIGDTKYNEDAAYQEIRNLINKDIDERIQSQQMQNIADAGGIANLAGGGIAKIAGDSSGRPPVSGPNPQGLLSLKNRVRNY